MSRLYEMLAVGWMFVAIWHQSTWVAGLAIAAATLALVHEHRAERAAQRHAKPRRRYSAPEDTTLDDLLVVPSSGSVGDDGM